jgi:long-chain acyl-CoA synthetase
VYEIQNITQLLRCRTDASPEKNFLFGASDGRVWTYSEFQNAVERAAALLAASGLGRGDVVSLLLPNSPEYIIAYFACFRLGAIAGPINSLLKPAEVAWVISNSEAKLVLTGKELGHAAGLIADDGRAVSEVPIVVFDRVEELVADQSLSADDGRLSLDDEAIIIYTSGTTGKPKGCLLTHGNLIANARQITEWLGFGTEDRLLTVMPLFHMNAVTVTTMTALYCGGSTVVAPKFSASRFWEMIEKFDITSFGSVATMLSMLLERGEGSGDPPAGRNSLRFAMCGSAPVPAEVLRRFEETFGCLVIEGYGLSESTCRSTFNPPNEDRRPGSCGLPIGNEMKVFDENDMEVPDGELGEIVLRGPNIFKGYFKNPAATEKAFTNGWFHTGDIGYRDTDGFFYIADRKSDMIIRGGENIYPREIDDLLYTHPAVAAAAVIGVPDELYGEDVAAFVVLKEGAAVSEGEMIDFCKKHLADYKCPKTIRFVPDIPKGPTGKLLKRELLEKVRNEGL